MTAASSRVGCCGYYWSGKHTPASCAPRRRWRTGEGGKVVAREKMSSVDTAWLHMDSTTNLMMIVGVMTFDTPLSLARLKTLLEGRLLVFFPGEHHPENHTYRLLDARDGWNYLAVPLLAKEA